MGKPATGTFSWPGGTVLRMQINGPTDQSVASISATEQPPSTMTYQKEGQTRSYATFRKWERCYQCGIEFPLEKMMRYQGKWYGVPCGDYRDIEQLKDKE